MRLGSFKAMTDFSLNSWGMNLLWGVLCVLLLVFCPVTPRVEINGSKSSVAIGVSICFYGSEGR